MPHSIAITGSGIICAIGNDKTTVAASLQNHKSGIGTMRYLRSVHQELPVGEVKLSNDELKERLGISLDMEISRTSLLGAYALRQAIDEAGLSITQLNGKRVTFISGTTVGGMDVTERYYHSMIEGNQEALKYITQHDCGSNTEEIANILGLKCEVTTISTACSSALNAIILGARMLLAHETDCVLAVGTESLSVFHLNGFNSLMILDHDPCRPFDATRQGLNLGEGAAYVVLERGDDIKREVSIQAYIRGYGNRCDAFHQTATSPNGEGAYLAMKDAIEMGRIAVDDIDYINAHGTGTPDNDRSESEAIKRLFGSTVPCISSTKSYTGHTTSASGSIETVISMIAMQHHFVPANISWKMQDENCITPQSTTEHKPLNNVLCNSFGFGGNDASLLLSASEVEMEDIAMKESRILAEYEVTHPEELKELKEMISPAESRRMGKLMKASLLTALKCLQKAGDMVPDAIIIATKFGMLENGEKILDSLHTNGEESISPTLFMQSTHNTLAGLMAIRFKSHGYNITYSQGDDSLDWAIRDAKKLLAENKAKTVLVGLHDECPPNFREFHQALGLDVPPEIYSKSILLTT